MSDRRRRRLEDEGEDETADTSVETETSSSSREGKVRVSECESEVDSGDVELSECDSESATGEGGDQEVETEEGSESETEEGSETEEASESETETDGGEDYTDEEGLDGERQSGDGEEQPDDDKPDDDEDRKNPAYVPRKGAFYEHDFRDGLEGEEEGQEEAPIETKAKKKLWQDEGKWAHDFYRDDLQAPKTSEELIAIYGYDIRAGDKPPEVSPRKPRRRGGGPRRENKFRDYLPRMAVIDTTEYGNDIVPNIDEDGLITYKDPVPNNNSHPSNGSRRGGRGGKFQRNNTADDIGRANNKQNHRRDDRNFSQSYGEQPTEDYPTLLESSRPRSFQEESGRGRKTNQPDNRYRETHQDNRYRETHQDNRYRDPPENRYRDSPENRYRDPPESRYRDSPENRYRDSYKKENRYRDSNQQDNRYRDSHQYGNEERSSNYNQNDSRRGGFRGGHRGRGSSNYRQSQDIRQQEVRMNEDNWNQRDSYENNRRDGRYNNRNEESRKIIITGDQNSPRTQMSRDDRNKNVKPQDRGYNNKQPPYQGGSGGGDGDHALPRCSGHDDYNNTSKRNNYRGYEQPPRYQQHQASREMREFTNTSYKGDDGLSGRNVQKPAPNSFGSGIGPGEIGDSKNDALPGKDLPMANVNTSNSNVEKKSYAKERRAKGTQRVGDPAIKDRPTGVPNSLDSATGTGLPQQYINTTPSVTTETASSQVAGGSKRYSSQRQQGLSKGSYTEPPPVDRGANLFNPALPPPSFYQRDPATSGQQPSSSSPAGVPDAPHFNPSILPPGTTALPYHLPAVPRPGLQMAGATGPPAVFRPPQGPPPATAIAQAGPALIAPPYIPPGMIYGAATAPPRVPPPGTPAGLSLPFAYTAPPPPNPLTGTAPTVSQADQMALASGQQTQQPANQPKKVYRGDIIYYAPELQQPSRTPQKRPKSAIPIVDPQEMRRLKELEAERGDNMQETGGSSKSAHSVNKSVTSAEGHSHSHQRRMGPADGPASEAPKPQRSSRERVVKEHTSGAPEKEQTVGVASGTPIDQGSLGNQQTADVSSRNSSKAVKDSSSLENNHINSSSPLPVAVESTKNEVLEVSKELSSLEINALSNKSKSGAGSTLSAVSDVQGDSVETRSVNRKVAETDVVVKSEEAAA